MAAAGSRVRLLRRTFRRRHANCVRSHAEIVGYSADAFLRTKHRQRISTGGPTACPAADSTIEEVQFPVPVDTAAQTILFIGDSMLEGLGPRLAAYASHNGHTLYNVVWYSSTSEVWGRSDKLQSYIRRLHPTYVIVCLGANELFVPRIAERRREYVEKSSPI